MQGELSSDFFTQYWINQSLHTENNWRRAIEIATTKSWSGRKSFAKHARRNWVRLRKSHKLMSMKWGEKKKSCVQDLNWWVCTFLHLRLNTRRLASRKFIPWIMVIVHVAAAQTKNRNTEEISVVNTNQMAFIHITWLHHHDDQSFVQLRASKWNWNFPRRLRVEIEIKIQTFVIKSRATDCKVQVNLCWSRSCDYVERSLSLKEKETCTAQACERNMLRNAQWERNCCSNWNSLISRNKFFSCHTLRLSIAIFPCT